MNYQAIQVYGNILSADLLGQLDHQDNVKGQKPADFGLTADTRVRDEISQAWSLANSFYGQYKKHLARLKPGQSSTSITRNHWLNPLLGLLGYNLHYQATAQELAGKNYHITDPAENLDGLPVLITAHEQHHDKKSAQLRLSPHALLQEYLNHSEAHLYGLLSNGRTLRLLRDSGRIIRLSYVEIDLERIFEEGLYPDFAAFFRLLHASRMPQKQFQGPECLLEHYHQEALESGTRIREKLSEAVKDSILLLGEGFLAEAANSELRRAYQKGTFEAQDYYRELLRLIYRFLFVTVIEERDLIYNQQQEANGAQWRQRDIYYKYYSLGRLRKPSLRAAKQPSRYHDLWQSVLNTFRLYEKGSYGSPLGVKPLNGELFGPNALPLLEGARLNNQVLLQALHPLFWFSNHKGSLQAINYRLLNVEEFGSVYEGLLEYDPLISQEGALWRFGFKAGEGRATSGSHYTPEELVQPLIKHSLDYLLQEREQRIDKAFKQQKLYGATHEAAREQVVAAELLSLRVCDVACGSGHILLSAARRIADRFAALVEESDQPTPSGHRKALRQVIKHCIYGVDKNPLAVELCKVALWLEAHNPGEPLSFLDHRIKCGDAIVGLARKDDLHRGIPNEAFKKLPHDDTEVCKRFVKENRSERQLHEKELNAEGELNFGETTDHMVQEAQAEYVAFAHLPENTPKEISRKAKAYEKFIAGKGYLWLRRMADAQVAQFFIPKTKAHEHALLTDGHYRGILNGTRPWQSQGLAKCTAIAAEKCFFHWFLEFPEVFSSPSQEEGRARDGSKNTLHTEKKTSRPSEPQDESGFDCILGNPPFLGNRGLKGAFGTDFLEYVKYTYAPAGAVDLVTYFFRRIFDLIRPGGFQSLISTNTIAQGNAREGGLDVITRDLGGSINHAIKSMRWPGAAAVEVALVTLHKGQWQGSYELGVNNEKVDFISTYLDDQENLGQPYKLFKNDGKSFIGSYVLGEGFIMSPEEAQELIAKNPKNKEVLFPYLNGQDLNSRPDQSASRWVINFFDWPLRRYSDSEWKALDQKERDSIRAKVKAGKFVHLSPPDSKESVALDYPDCLNIVEQKIKPERTRWKKDKDGNDLEGHYALRYPLHERWWHYADKRPALYRAIKGLHNPLVVAQVSKTVAFTSVSQQQVLDAKLIVFALDQPWQLGLLQSTLHYCWAWKYCTTMKNDLTYTPSVVFEPFPLIKEPLIGLSDLSTSYIELRKQIMTGLVFGLTKLYNLFHLKDLDAAAIETASKQSPEVAQQAHKDILQLRQLHQQMDEAVREAYGWSDLNLRHDFYEVDYLPENDNVRFTIHPEARKEVLKRLLLLNHQYYEEELLQGLHPLKDALAYYQQKGQPMPDGLDQLCKKYKENRKAYKSPSIPLRAPHDNGPSAPPDSPTGPLRTPQTRGLSGAEGRNTHKKPAEAKLDAQVTLRNSAGQELQYLLTATARTGDASMFGIPYLNITTDALGMELLNRSAGYTFSLNDKDWELVKVE